MNLLISFDNTSPSYAHGVEFGRLWGMMEAGIETVSNKGFPVRVENIAVLKSACEQYDYTPVFGQESFGEWVEFMAIKNKTTNN